MNQHLLTLLTSSLFIVTFALAGPPPGQGYVETWSDEFSGTSIDQTKWTPDLSNGSGTLIPGAYNTGQLNWKYLDYALPENVILEDGICTLLAKEDDIGPIPPYDYTYDYSSGWINTMDKMEYQYGYIELRAKFPIGDKTWPAFWTIAADLNWPPEIDIAEYFGTYGDHPVMHHGIYNENNAWVSQHNDNYFQGQAAWHVWALEWTEDELKFYVDDIVVYTVTAAMSPIPQEPMYVVINNGVHYQPDANWNTTFPTTFELDYIRLYEISEDPCAGTSVAISGDNNVSDGDAVTYTASGVSDYTHTWTVPNGATIQSGQGTNSISVLWGSTEGNVSVSATGDCGTYTDSYAITVSDPCSGYSIAISGNNNVVEADTEIYNITDSQSSTLTWSVPSGATIQSGQGTTEISVLWGATSGNISVQAVNTCGTTTDDLSVDVTDLCTGYSIAISGNNDVGDGDTESYSITDSQNSTITWTAPNGATIQSGQGTAQISVLWGATAGNVSVQAINGCGTYTDDLAVSVTDPCLAITADITGSSNVSENTSTTYSVHQDAGFTYAWAVPNEASISNGDGTSEITVLWGTISGDVTCQITKPCETISGSLSITVAPPSDQSPYGGTPWPIPGTVEAEDFDDGASGEAYFDVDEGNKTGYDPRPGTDVDVAIGGSNWIINEFNTTEWLEYTINITQSGSYDFSFNMAHGMGTDQPFTISIDGSEIETIQVPSTGWNTFDDIAMSTIPLTVGNHIIQIKSGSTNSQFDYFTGTFITEAKELDNYLNIKVYPIPFSNSFTINFGQENIVSCNIYSLNGTRVEQVITNSTQVICGEKLNKGMYILETTTTKNVKRQIITKK